MAILELEHVSKRYARRPTATVALEDVSIELDRGEVMGVFGPVGSGKTTLLRVAAGLEPADAGHVLFDGEPLDLMSPRRRSRYLRREVGCAWAAEEWSPGLTAIEHVALPLLVDHCDRRSAERRARRAMAACGVDGYEDAEPAELSDGERQLVAVARAMVIEPKLLLLDGMAAGLSLLEQDTLAALLASLADELGTAVLATAREAAALPRTTPLLYIRSGRLINAPKARLAEVLPFPEPATSRAAGDA